MSEPPKIMGEEVEELVKRLRGSAASCGAVIAQGNAFYGMAGHVEMMTEAADTIESLRASLTRVEEERDEARARAVEWFRVAQRAEPVTVDDIEWAEQTAQALGLSRADGEKAIDG